MFFWENTKADREREGKREKALFCLRFYRKKKSEIPHIQKEEHKEEARRYLFIHLAIFSFQRD